MHVGEFTPAGGKCRVLAVSCVRAARRSRIPCVCGPRRQQSEEMIEGLESADALLKASLIIACPVRHPASACDGEREKDQRREDEIVPLQSVTGNHGGHKNDARDDVTWPPARHNDGYESHRGEFGERPPRPTMIHGPGYEGIGLEASGRQNVLGGENVCDLKSHESRNQRNLCRHEMWLRKDKTPSRVNNQRDKLCLN